MGVMELESRKFVVRLVTFFLQGEQLLLQRAPVLISEVFNFLLATILHHPLLLPEARRV
jgi:hypothetical protein